MGSRHLSRLRDLAVALADGGIELGELLQIQAALVELVRLSQRAVSQEESQQEEHLADSMAFFESRIFELREQAELLATEAQAVLELLLGLPQEQRLRRIERSLRRFRNPILADLLLDESYQAVSRNAQHAYELAEIAHAVSLRLVHHEVGEDRAMTCLARSQAHKGNALRAMNRFAEAEPLLEFGYGLFLERGIGDPSVEVELACLLSSLRRDQRRFSEAQELLREAISVAEEIQEPRLFAEVVIRESTVHSQMGDSEEALASLERVFSFITPKDERHLYLCAMHNRLWYLSDLGRFAECQELLTQNLNLYQAAPGDSFKLRLRWLMARLASGEGQLAAAADGFEALQNAFRERDLEFDAALVGLDLALVYLQEHRLTEVRELTETLVPVFLAQDIEREALAAIKLFADAARQEALTVAIVTDVERLLRRARAIPLENPS